MSDEGLKARLMEEAKRAIDELIAEKSAPDQITLREMEQLAIKVGRAVREEGIPGLVEASEKGRQGEKNCPTGGKKGQRRGKRVSQVVSEAGEGRVERHYYYCERCGHGAFPPR